MLHVLNKFISEFLFILAETKKLYQNNALMMCDREENNDEYNF